MFRPHRPADKRYLGQGDGPVQPFPGPNRTGQARSGMAAPLGLLGAPPGSLYSANLALKVEYSA